MRKFIRKIIPLQLRLYLRIFWIKFQDLCNGSRSRFAKVAHQSIENKFPYEIFTLQQEIKRTAHYEGKLKNLKLAADKINHLIIHPGQIFSFWNLIKNPTVARGFATGRMIFGDSVHAGTGGGLCQISGLFYIVALRLNFDILERHPHSMDIYTDETRFSPLGSDASIVYGYKDLRFKNNTENTYQFSITVFESKISLIVSSDRRETTSEIEFQMSESADKGIRIAKTMQKKDDGTSVVLKTDTYRVFRSE